MEPQLHKWLLIFKIDNLFKFLGVPVWWNTTTVQRAASLPLKEISNLISGNEIQQTVTTQMTFFFQTCDGKTDRSVAKALYLEQQLKTSVTVGNKF